MGGGGRGGGFGITAHRAKSLPFQQMNEGGVEVGKEDGGSWRGRGGGQYRSEGLRFYTV